MDRAGVNHMTKRLLCSFLLLSLCACSGGSSGGGGAAPAATQTSNTTVGLTDAPSDDLSVLQVEITGLSVEDGAGTQTSLFPGAGGATLTVNLLRLRGFSRLLTSLALPQGTYTRLLLSYRAATAVDRAGNALSVTPSSGTATGVFAGGYTVTGSHRYVEVDFDVDASVGSLTTGPGGSLQLQPVLLLEVEDSGVTRELEDFKARVQAVGTNTLDVALGAGTARVQVDGATQLVAGGRVTSLSSGASLAALFAPGDAVEVRGRYDVNAKLVRAAAVELEDGLGFSASGPELEGLVVALGSGQVSVLVLDPRDSGALVGSTRAFALGANTQYGYDHFPAVAASESSLALGQEVRTFGSGTANGVKLRQTRLEGTVLAVDAAQRQLQVTVTRLERVDVARVPGFANPVLIQLDGPVPAAAAVNAAIELQGQFNRTAPGVFDVAAAGVQPDVDDDQLEGVIFSVLSTNPLRVELTGDGGLLGNPLTATVALANGATIVERDAAGVSTPTSEADLAAGIAAGRYDELRAKGTYDANTGLRTATSIRADLP
jgi:hypothetical protein